LALVLFSDRHINFKTFDPPFVRTYFSRAALLVNNNHMTDVTSDVSSQEFDPKLMDRKLNTGDNMSVVSDLSETLDEQEFDHTLAADLHLAIVEVGTPYGDLGHMAQKQTAAFLPDDGSFGEEELIDNAGLFPDAPEAIGDIEGSKFNGHTEKIPKDQSQSMKNLDAGLFGESSGGIQSPVGKVSAFHSTFESLEPPVTPKAARRHIKKQMHEGFHSAGTLSRPKLSVGSKSRKKGSKYPIHNKDLPVSPVGTYGDLGGISESQAASFLPDHSASLHDGGFFLVDSPEQIPESRKPKVVKSSKGRKGSKNKKHGDLGGMPEEQEATSFHPDNSISDLGDLTLCLDGSANANEIDEFEGSGEMQSPVGKQVAAFHSSFVILKPPETPKAARRGHVKKQMHEGFHSAGTLNRPKLSFGSKSRKKGSKHPSHKDLPISPMGTYGDLGGISESQAASFLPDHSASLHDGGFFLVDSPEQSPAVSRKPKVVKSSKGRKGSKTKKHGDLGGMPEEQASTSFPQDHSISDLADLTLCLDGSPVKKSSKSKKKSHQGNSGRKGSKTKKHAGDLGGMPEEQATSTSFPQDHSISDLADLTLCLDGSPVKKSKSKKKSHQEGNSSRSKATQRDQSVSEELSDTSIGMLSLVNANEMDEFKEGSVELQSPVGSLKSPMTPKAARPRHVKKQMHEGFHSAGTLNRPKLSGVGRRKVKDALSNSNHSIGKRNAGTGNPYEEAGTYYGDRGGMSVKQTTSFLPDHSISDLGDLTLCLGGGGGGGGGSSANANEMDDFENSIFGIGT
jgi:hypothetical protein